MKEAVESDLVNVNVQPGGHNNIRAQATEVERLKQEIFKAYLHQTQDFKESIYGAGENPPTPTPAPVPTAKPTPGLADTSDGSGSDLTQKPDNESDKEDAPVTGDVKTGPKLLLCRVTSAKNSQTIRWNPVKSAEGYEIYGAKDQGMYKRLRTVSKKSSRWKHKK